jgi:glycosyltransferase involved in cell wall biosynthesis
LNVCGGVRVILRLAEHLTNLGHNVSVLAHKTNDGVMWLLPNPNFRVIRAEDPYTKQVPKDTDVVIDFLDGNIAPIPKGTKRVLFLQGYGTQNKAKEDSNLLLNYDAIITTSEWLHDVASVLKNRPIYIVPPGVDSYFRPKIVTKNYFHIGGLYHRSAEKNTNLFIRVANNFYAATKGLSMPLLLSAKFPKDNTILSRFTCPYSLMVNSPQKILPDIYSAMSTWISTSSNEGFGLTALEAMACGVPVIMFPNLGLDKFISHGDNCLIGRSEREILENLDLLRKNSTLRNTLISGGLSLSKQFTWEKSAKLFEKVLKGVVK